MTDESSPGIQIVKQGRARVFINSRDGKQLTLQRILENELSVIGVSCVLDNVIFNVSLETETACEVALIPRVICKQLFSKNIAVKDSVIDMITVKFSQTMRILETVTFSSMGSRLANALIEQSSFAGSEIFTVTHESIAADLGTAREVVTRLLNQFQTDGLVKLLRGKIEINNMQALAAMRGEALR
ncbi:MAG: Crp/Fnr family transcriptional regulator, partial [Oscillospiraceae bacterium]|nr:Crp/Fnr family transcriptional regulator [Oscillospiraceae bacterium]